ncbi:hypothetical protein BD770DRAFT_400921 [Pilaira anomala]|nr:hypothetical protein BD770DRAFT_400921 [Pilaira anomala]
MNNEPKQGYSNNNMACPTPKVETPSHLPPPPPPPPPHTPSSSHQHQQPTDLYKDGHVHMLTTTIPASKVTHHHVKPTYAADNYHDQADQLFRSAVLIQQRMQSNKYHPLQLPRDPSGASNQVNQSSSSSSSSPHPIHHHPYYPSPTSLPSHHHQADFTQTTINNPITPSYQPSHHSFYHSQHFQ